MRTSFIVLLAAVALLLSVAAGYTVVEKSGYCTRALSAKSDSTQRTVVLTGAKGCTDSQSLAVLVFSVSCNFIPYFRLMGLGAKNDTESITVAAAVADLVFDSVIEYKETNNIPGYQPLRWNGTNFIPGDFIVRWAPLGSIIPGYKWSTIKHTATVLDDSTSKLHNLSFTDKYGLNWFNMRYDVEITSKELKDGKRSLRPNSFKLNLDVSDITYSSAESTGVAFGMIFATRGGIVKHNITKNTRDGDSDEDMVDVMNEKGNREIYFSWNRTVVVNGDRPAEVKTSEWSVESSTPDGYESQAEFALHRLWYSVDERVSSIAWDPSVGAPEAPDNSAGRAVVSLLSLIVAVFVTLTLI